jgi:hypothetical protein
MSDSCLPEARPFLDEITDLLENYEQWREYYMRLTHHTEEYRHIRAEDHADLCKLFQVIKEINASHSAKEKKLSAEEKYDTLLHRMYPKLESAVAATELVQWLHGKIDPAIVTLFKQPAAA